MRHFSAPYVKQKHISTLLCLTGKQPTSQYFSKVRYEVYNIYFYRLHLTISSVFQPPTDPAQKFL